MLQEVTDNSSSEVRVMQLGDLHIDEYNVRATKLHNSDFTAAVDGVSGLRYLFVHVVRKYHHLMELLAPYSSAEAAALAHGDAAAASASADSSA